MRDAAAALKLFLPSWNFFNDFSATPELEFRLKAAQQEESAWQPLFPTGTTCRLHRVLYNPEGNLELLERSQVERAAEELGDFSKRERDDFCHSLTYATLLRLVRRRIGEHYPGKAAAWCQFRVISANRDGTAGAQFLSTNHPLVQRRA